MPLSRPTSVAAVIVAALTACVALSGCDSSGRQREQERAASEKQAQEAETLRRAAEAESLRRAEEAENRRLAEEAERTRLALVSKTCIETVLQQDASIPQGSSASVVASRMQTFDTMNCPSEFREAFLVHTQAWSNAARIDRSLAVLNSDENIGNTLGQQLVDSLFKTGNTPYRDHADADRRLRAARSAAFDDIRTTYQDVQRVAVRYGARLPPS